MGKGKLQKFADMREYPNVVEHHSRCFSFSYARKLG